MDLARTPEDEKLRVCRKYFIGGFFFLPFAWLVNAVWFGQEAFKSGGNPQMKKYVIMSAIGALAWAIGLGVWAATFQAKRDEWGATGDDLSAYIPRGDV
eukprot:m.479627 g.479627  ORF g.479627 m.479627 type:complete len:99 (-) comp21531_c0_seq1:112-408(-)